MRSKHSSWEILSTAHRSWRITATVGYSRRRSYRVAITKVNQYITYNICNSFVQSYFQVYNQSLFPYICIYRLRGNCPNNYTLTKAIGEDVIRKYGSGMPACVVRPSIVISTADEPTAGWTNNLYGATGVVVGSAYGILRTLNCNENNFAEIIPVDYVINTIIAAAWDVGHTWWSISFSCFSSNSCFLVLI